MDKNMLLWLTEIAFRYKLTEITLLYGEKFPPSKKDIKFYPKLFRL